MKIVIDTNIWISTLLSTSFRERVVRLVTNIDLDILGHTQLLQEIVQTSQKPKIQKYVSQEQVAKMLEIVKNRVDLVNYHSSLDICRDEKDNFLLAIAKDNQAQYIITGDNDLLVLNPFEDIQIVTLTAFEIILNS